MSASCPRCGELIDASRGSEFCPNCGASLTATACGHCGRALVPGANFCDGCGTPAGAEPSVAPTEVVPRPEPTPATTATLWVPPSVERTPRKEGLAGIARSGSWPARLAVVLLLLPFWLTSELRQTSWPLAGKIASIGGVWLLTATAAAAPGAPPAPNERITDPVETGRPTELAETPSPSPERFSAAPDGWPKPGSDAIEAFVTDVTDGDTIVLSGIDIGKTHSSGGRSARLIGIDTPEVFGASECFGAEASAFTKREIESRQVLVEFDVEKVDRFDRALVYVWQTDGRLFNGRLAAEGYAQQLTIPPNVRFAELFTRLVREARDADRGLWAGCGVDVPQPTSGGTGPASCHPSYSPQCLDPNISDYDCEGGGGNGPAYVRGPVEVHGSDPYGLDRDNDGVGCESEAPAMAPAPDPTPPTGGGGGNCHPSYPDFCIPPPPPDLDCKDVSSDFRVLHNVSNPDPHGFDADHDGVGCES